MNRRSYLSAAVGGAGVLSGCLSRLPLIGSDVPDRPLPNTPMGSWRQYGADGANSSARDVSVPSRGNLAWTLEDYTQCQPAVSDGVVYTTVYDRTDGASAIALDAQDGTERWRTALGDSEAERTIVVDDRCIVPYESDLVALDRRTGDRVWTEPIIDRYSLSVVVADEATGTVLVDSIAGIEAYRASNGARRWQSDPVDYLAREPAIDDRHAYVVGDVDETPSLVALSLADGSVRWRRELEDTPEQVAPVASPVGVIVSDDGTLVVHDGDTGDRLRELRSFGTDRADAPVSVAFDDGTVFVTTEYSGAVALDGETGAERWHIDVPVDYTGGLCVGNETVVFPVEDPEYAPKQDTISAFDRDSGDLRWHYAFEQQLHSFVSTQPVLVDGAVFVTATYIDGRGVRRRARSRELGPSTGRLSTRGIGQTLPHRLPVPKFGVQITTPRTRPCRVRGGRR
ncbi:PQQ-binding-like beta-propeller repeat protein [Halovivax cerinus]|uniref:PQQ-binding-like beta-propeller repeat protein n=1 Tax=Halovivax cerinus TaxID=1487865 RepID=A0ABD5NT07_9EURY|nr:PQQ-binding-like beta-propeller repeat protein [Halovivax cerinus]